MNVVVKKCERSPGEMKLKAKAKHTIAFEFILIARSFRTTE